MSDTEPETDHFWYGFVLALVLSVAFWSLHAVTVFVWLVVL